MVYPTLKIRDFLSQNISKAIDLLELSAEVEVITDVDQMLNYNIKGIPALIINGEVVTEMVIPTVSYLVNWFKNHEIAA